jgi:hypothetical protein
VRRKSSDLALLATARPVTPDPIDNDGSDLTLVLTF